MQWNCIFMFRMGADFIITFNSIKWVRKMERLEKLNFIWWAADIVDGENGNVNSGPAYFELWKVLNFIKNNFN